MEKAQKLPRFKNIVLQDEDGTVHVYEPGTKGLSIILLVCQEGENNSTQVRVRSAYTLPAGATLIHEFLSSNKDLIPSLVAVSMKELIDMKRMAEEPEGGRMN